MVDENEKVNNVCIGRLACESGAVSFIITSPLALRT